MYVKFKLFSRENFNDNKLQFKNAHLKKEKEKEREREKMSYVRNIC